jgi:hypothetical protein
LASQIHIIPNLLREIPVMDNNELLEMLLKRMKDADPELGMKIAEELQDRCENPKTVKQYKELEKKLKKPSPRVVRMLSALVFMILGIALITPNIATGAIVGVIVGYFFVPRLFSKKPVDGLPNRTEKSVRKVTFLSVLGLILKWVIIVVIICIVIVAILVAISKSGTHI